MYCSKCGAEISEGTKFCPRCGAAVAKVHDTGETLNAGANVKTTISSGTDPTTGVSGNRLSSRGRKGAKAVSVPRKSGARKLLLLGIPAVLVIVAIVLICRPGKSDSSLKKAASSGQTNVEQANPEGEGITIESDVQSAYYHDFVNLLPLHEDVPYVEISGDNLYPSVSYNWMTVVRTHYDEEYPYERLRKAYSYALSDLYSINGRPEKELEMAQYFYCKNSINALDGEVLDTETQNAADGLLWYLTFLNYHCEIETEETEYGTLVHAKISNADVVKLLYEELENTYNMVREDNAQAASERLSNAFSAVRTYIDNQAENYSHLDHIDYTIRPSIGLITVSPVYGNELVSKLNLVEFAGGLIFSQAKYQQNRNFWADLSDDGTLYNYTLANMLERMENGDYDTVQSEVSFYAEVDSRGIGYLPFDMRANITSFVLADNDWDWDMMLDYWRSRGFATSQSNTDNILDTDKIFSFGYNAKHDYENMLFWLAMGWRGCVVSGNPVKESPDSIAYTGKVEAVTEQPVVEQPEPQELYYGDSVQAYVDRESGMYVVDGVLYDLSSGEAVAVGTTADFSAKELRLPAEINGRPLTTLGEFAISECSSLESIWIPEGVVTMEKSALNNNENLAYISFPNTLQVIAGCMGLSSLKTITIPSSVTEIAAYSFMTCVNLEKVTIPENVKEIGYSAFDQCYSLTAYVPKTTKCGDCAFRDTTEVIYY